YNKHPLNFKPHGLSCISIKTDGYESKVQTIDVDYTNDNYVNGYNSITLALADRDKGNGNNIDYAKYKQGFAMYLFNISLSATTNGLQPMRYGSLKVSNTNILNYQSVL